MPEKLNVKVSAPENKKDIPPIQIKPDLRGVINWIRAKNLEPTLEKAMIKKVQRWPHQALMKFVETFQDHVIKVQEKRNSQ